MAPRIKTKTRKALLPQLEEEEEEEEEEELEEEREEGSQEDSGEAQSQGNAAAAAYPNPKRSKPSSGAVAASPKPKKVRAAPSPSPSPRRARKPSIPPQEDDDGSDQVEAAVEDPGDGSAETDSPAASPPPKPSAASPKRNKRGAAPMRTTKVQPAHYGDAADERASQGEVDADGLQESAGAAAEADSPAASPPRKPSAAPKRGSKVQPSHDGDGAQGEVQADGVQESGDDNAPPTRKRTKPAGGNALASASHTNGSRKLPVKPRSNGDRMDEEDGTDKSAEMDDTSSHGLLQIAKANKKPAQDRCLWSREDELRILTTVAHHAKANDGALPEVADLFADLAASFDKRDADADKLAWKIRKLKGCYNKVRLQGCPADDHGRQLFELSEVIWGNGPAQDIDPATHTAPRRSQRKTANSGLVAPKEANQAGSDGGELGMDVDVGKEKALPLAKHGDVTSSKCKANGGLLGEHEQSLRREFSELSGLYPYLAKEVKEYADTHPSGPLIMAAFETIGDDKALSLEARCKKQRVYTFRLERRQARLTKAVLDTLAGQMN